VRGDNRLSTARDYVDVCDVPGAVSLAALDHEGRFVVVFLAAHDAPAVLDALRHHLDRATHPSTTY